MKNVLSLDKKVKHVTKSCDKSLIRVVWLLIEGSIIGHVEQRQLTVLNLGELTALVK